MRKIVLDDAAALVRGRTRVHLQLGPEIDRTEPRRVLTRSAGGVVEADLEAGLGPGRIHRLQSPPDRPSRALRL